MTYCVENFRTKKALREAVAERDVAIYQPGPWGRRVQNGTVYLEGPHYPEPHKWYAIAESVNNTIPKGSKVR